LTPDVASLIYYLNRAIHDSAKGLTPREQEIAALVVSSLNA
jgi:DNA-binding CsgD family transcriptional regulator